MAPVTLRIAAPAERVWRIIGEVHRIIPSLSDSRLVTTGALGPGSARLCTLVKPLMGIEVVEERVTEWRDGRSFTYVFDRPPWPFARVINTWAMEPDGQQTKLTLAPSLVMRGGAWTRWLAAPALWAMSRSLKADLPLVVEAIQRECKGLET